MTGRPNTSANGRLKALPSGRHYGASADGQCWVMIGRDLRDVDAWSIVPPDASITLCWGDGGCTVAFAGGVLEMRRGDLMWIDAGFAHRGENLPGSDFLTIFVPDPYVTRAALHLAPIGARAKAAPIEVFNMMVHLAALWLDGGPTRNIEAPFVDAILDWVGTTFEPNGNDLRQNEPIRRAAAILRDHQGSELRISYVADIVGLSNSTLSHQFKEHFKMSPMMYRKQLRLALATRALASGKSVLTAAHDAGFADSSHLSRTFRSQYGISPSHWAQRVGRVSHNGTT